MIIEYEMLFMSSNSNMARKPNAALGNKPKASHPWKSFNPGWLSRPPVPGLGYQPMQGITKPNRAK